MKVTKALLSLLLVMLVILAGSTLWHPVRMAYILPASPSCVAVEYFELERFLFPKIKILWRWECAEPSPTVKLRWKFINSSGRVIEADYVFLSYGGLIQKGDFVTSRVPMLRGIPLEVVRIEMKIE